MATLPGARVISVASWRADEDNPVFPLGSQPKTLLLCPEEGIDQGLIPGHRYLFKNPSNWQRMQIWSEIIAYEVGCLCGIEVPRAFPAVDANGNFGVLVEFFYGVKLRSGEERFVHGSDLLDRLIKDRKRGRPHGIQTNIRLTQAYGVSDAPQRWAAMIAFDALIGNTDRHPDNWGILHNFVKPASAGVRLAPAFDNGTSFGHEIPDSKISDRMVPRRLADYLDQGKHHCGWSPREDGRVQHSVMCARLASHDDDAGETINNVVRFDPAPLA